MPLHTNANFLSLSQYQPPTVADPVFEASLMHDLAWCTSLEMYYVSCVVYLTVHGVAEKTAIMVFWKYFVRVFFQAESNFSCSWVSFYWELYAMVQKWCTPVTEVSNSNVVCQHECGVQKPRAWTSVNLLKFVCHKVCGFLRLKQPSFCSAFISQVSLFVPRSNCWILMWASWSVVFSEVTLHVARRREETST